jgi:hypothetical protein
VVLRVPAYGVVAEFKPLAKNAMRHAVRQPDLDLMSRLMRTNAARNSTPAHNPNPRFAAATYPYPVGYIIDDAEGQLRAHLTHQRSKKGKDRPVWGGLATARPSLNG